MQFVKVYSHILKFLSYFFYIRLYEIASSGIDSYYLPLLFLTAAVLYYYLYKRSTEYLGDPRLYEDCAWLRDAFARARLWSRSEEQYKNCSTFRMEPTDLDPVLELELRDSLSILMECFTHGLLLGRPYKKHTKLRYSIHFKNEPYFNIC